MKKFKVSFNEQVIQRVVLYVEAEDLETANRQWRVLDWTGMTFMVKSSVGMLDDVLVVEVVDGQD